MKYRTEFLHCGQPLKDSLSAELEEIFSIIRSIQWAQNFSYTRQDKTFQHQTAYNQAFQNAFKELGWEVQPKLRDAPRLIGDFQKDLVFGEIQFGNSSTLYRDFYKFQYGLLVDRGAQTCAEIKECTEAHLVNVRAKIVDLTRIEVVLAATAALCTGNEVPDCPVLEALAS